MEIHTGRSNRRKLLLVVLLKLIVFTNDIKKLTEKATEGKS